MIDSESRILAGILPDLTARVEKAQIRLITDENFDDPNLRTLWRIIDTYYDDHLAIIPEWVLKEKSKNMGMSEAKSLQMVELYKALSKLPVQEHEFNEAIRLLKENELTRKTDEAIVTAREILMGEFYDENGDKILKGQDAARSYLSESLQSLETLGAEFAPEGDVRDDVENIWSTYLHRESNPDELGGIKYGIMELDEFTGGVRPGELVLVAGFTGSGKSHMITSLAWNAMLAGKNVLMFTTETTREEMEIRILARHSRQPKFKTPGGIDSHDIMSGTLAPADKQVFREVLDDFNANDHGHLFMVQMPASGSVDYVHAKANQYNRRAPIDLIVIDSINLLRLGRKYPSKREMLEDMLQDFKRFASAFDNGRGVAVVSPWQMSRTSWKEAVEAGGTYTLASLADTSEAEKCQPLTSNVLTMKGFRPMGDIRVGEVLVDSDGQPQEVLEVHDNGVRPIYRVETNDGAVVECTPGHIWTVLDAEGNSKDMTAQEIMDSDEIHYLPVLATQPNYFADKHDVGDIFSSTLLGYMLQDEYPSPGYISAAPQYYTHIHNQLKVLPEFAVTTESGPRFVWSATELDGDPNMWIMDGAGLFGGDYNKFKIPPAYLQGSHYVREALIRTFMKDPQAQVHKPKVSYEDLEGLPFDHPGYGEQLKQLVRSLGWPLTKEPRHIVAVRDTGRQEQTKCITVSNPNGLYITDGFVVTHNSASQIITIFKDDEPGNGGRLNIQGLKNRSGKEMSKVSYPYDYRNSYIGTSGEASPRNKPANNSVPQVVQDISSML